MSKHVFGFERWEQWVTDKARALLEAGQFAELQISHKKTPKPGFSFRFKTDRALGQFGVWITGEAHFDIMDDFMTRMNCHPISGRIVPESMRSAWFSAKSSP